jgi:hypothetical protein
MRSVAFASLSLPLLLVLLSNMESLEWKKLSVGFSSQQPFWAGFYTYLTSQWCKPSICLDYTQHGQSNPIFPNNKAAEKGNTAWWSDKGLGHLGWIWFSYFLFKVI